MANHACTAKIGAFALPKNSSAIILEVWGENGKLGTLKLGQGSVRWYKVGAHKKGKRGPTASFTWTQFAERMDAKGKKKK